MTLSPESAPWNSWDLWCLIAARDRYEGRLSRLRDAIFERRADPRRRTTSVTDQVLEDLLSHTPDLEARVRNSGSVEQALELVPDSQIKAERGRARRLFGSLLDEDDSSQSDFAYPLPSPVMLRSPGRVFDQEARERYWPALPVNPAGYIERLQPQFAPPKRITPESFKELISSLSGVMNDELARIEALVANRRAHRYALYRAALFLLAPAFSWAPCSNDPALIQLGRQWMDQFLAFHADDLGCTPEVFLEDFMRALLWEHPGLTDDGRIAAYLDGLWPEERTIAACIVENLARTGRENFRDGPAGRAEYLLQLLRPRSVETN